MNWRSFEASSFRRRCKKQQENLGNYPSNAFGPGPERWSKKLYWELGRRKKRISIE